MLLYGYFNVCLSIYLERKCGWAYSQFTFFACLLFVAGSETDEVVESKGNADSTGGQEAAKSNASLYKNYL